MCVHFEIKMGKQENVLFTSFLLMVSGFLRLFRFADTALEECPLNHIYWNPIPSCFTQDTTVGKGGRFILPFVVISPLPSLIHAAHCSLIAALKSLFSLTSRGCRIPVRPSGFYCYSL